MARVLRSTAQSALAHEGTRWLPFAGEETVWTVEVDEEIVKLVEEHEGAMQSLALQ